MESKPKVDKKNHTTKKSRSKPIVLFAVSVVILVLIFFVIFYNRGDSESKGPSLRGEPGGEVAPPNTNYPKIGTVKKITNCANLNIESSDVEKIADFENAEVEEYPLEIELSDAKLSIKNEDSICKKYLELDYQHNGDPSRFHAARIHIMGEDNVGLLKHYKYLNFIARFNKATNSFGFFVIDKDEDFWWFNNVDFLEEDTWYWFKIPIKDLYIDEKYPMQGDNKQDFDDGLTITFEGSLDSNIVYFDSFFLSNS